MDSPVRKMLKRNDYNRHKLLRKIRRLRRAQVEQQKVAAEKELKRRLRVTPPKFGDGKDPYGTVIADLKNTRINPDTGGVQLVDNEGNIIAQEGGYELPEIVVNGVDVNRIRKHANTAYNDNVRVGSEIPTYARMYEPDETVLLATSVPGALISAPLWGPALLGASDAALETTLGQKATQFFTNPYTQAAMFSTGLADTVDRRLIRGQHPNYSENPLMAGIEDVFDASMILGGTASGLNILRNTRPIRKPISPKQQLLLENALQDLKLLPKLKYTMSDIVDSEGNINTKNAMAILRDVVGKNGVNLNRQHYHTRLDMNGTFTQPTIRHMWESAKTAKSLPIPKGGTKQELVFAALSHDIGRLLQSGGHGEKSAEILKEYFNNLPENVLQSIQKHMGYNMPFESDFVKALHAADVGSGMKGDLTLRRFPYLGYTSSENVTNLGKGGNLDLRTTIRTKLNPYFDTMRMQKIPLDATEEEARRIVRENMKLYRHVGRGLSMPVYGNTHTSHTVKNQQNAVALTRQAVGSENFTSDDIFKTMITHASLEDTGHGKSGFGEFANTLQGPNERHGAQPIYTSNTKDVMSGYSGNTNLADDASAAVGAYVPEVYNENMSLEDIILANEWPLYNNYGQLHAQYDYETPYRLATGKSLREAAYKYLLEHTSEYPEFTDIAKKMHATNSLYPDAGGKNYLVNRAGNLLDKSTNGRLKDYFEKYKQGHLYKVPKDVLFAMEEIVRDENNINMLKREATGKLVLPYLPAPEPGFLSPFGEHRPDEYTLMKDHLSNIAHQCLPKDELNIFMKHLEMITSKKRNVSKDKIISDIKDELLSRANSVERHMADRFFKYRDEENKRIFNRHLKELHSTFSKDFTSEDKKVDIYEKLMKQHGVLPMHSTNEMRNHPYAFTTEGLRRNVSRLKEQFNTRNHLLKKDDHQHYVFYGQNGTLLLEDAEILDIKNASSRHVGHGGRRHPDFTPKMNSLYPFALPFIGYGLNSKDNHKKK